LGAFQGRENGDGHEHRIVPVRTYSNVRSPVALARAILDDVTLWKRSFGHMPFELYEFRFQQILEASKLTPEQMLTLRQTYERNPMLLYADLTSPNMGYRSEACGLFFHDETSWKLLASMEG
jgi:hypothetical protein